MDVPVTYSYQRALDALRREGHASAALLKRMSELISLLDLTTTLNSSLSGGEILEAALLVVMGELRARRGCLLVGGEGGEYLRRASRGLPPGAPETLSLEAPPPGVFLKAGDAAADAALASLGLELLYPIYRRGRPIALLGLGGREDGFPYSDEDVRFLRSVADCAATPIENGLIHHELERLNHRLSVKVYQLNSLFDITRELVTSEGEETIHNLVATTLMGHLLVSRCVLYLRGPGGLALALARGLREDAVPCLVPEAEAAPTLAALSAARNIAELPRGSFRERMLESRLALAVPLSLGGATEGLLAVGERLSGVPFTEEDADFAFTLGRQALAALENVRLNRMRAEKQRQDRELQIAREIQRSLFPRACPPTPGFSVAADSRSCYEVGGDHYDFIPLGGDRVGLAIADVSGKGTPASILMASVHASLRALAGTVPPAVLMDRLNRFLFASTQANKFVTMFYGELDPARRCLAYVNAGHVPPYRVGRGGRARLETGGVVLGLLEGVSYEVGEVELWPGDVVVMVTDGVTEALSPADDDFGDERVFAALEASRSGSAPEILSALVAEVDAWTATAGCTDDLTALIVKAL